MAKTVQGKTYQWRLGDAPIGSGDAGEVYAVVCVEQPDLSGVLKKPSRIATGGTIQRQAGQIAQEGLALAQLEGLPECKAHPPQILDEAPEFTHGTANYFIVSETAPGEDMAAMLVRTRQASTRGAGCELRLYNMDPDKAEARARAHGYEVLAPSEDKSHGLRECYLVDPEGYVWVPGRPLPPG